MKLIKSFTIKQWNILLMWATCIKIAGTGLTDTTGPGSHASGHVECKRWDNCAAYQPNFWNGKCK